MNNKIRGSDIEVSKEDQVSINNFSKLFTKTKESQETLRQLAEKINQQNDTMDQMQINDDDDPVRYRFGNTFFTISTAQAKLFVQKELQVLKKQQKNIKDDLEESTKKMRKLKATLYSKFGNSINLDE